MPNERQALAEVIGEREALVADVYDAVLYDGMGTTDATALAQRVRAALEEARQAGASETAHQLGQAQQRVAALDAELAEARGQHAADRAVIAEQNAELARLREREQAAQAEATAVRARLHTEKEEGRRAGVLEAAGHLYQQGSRALGDEVRALASDPDEREETVTYHCFWGGWATDVPHIISCNMPGHDHSAPTAGEAQP